MITKNHDGAGEGEGYGAPHGCNHDEEYIIITNTGEATSAGGVRSGNAREDGVSFRRYNNKNGKHLTPYAPGYCRETGQGTG